MTSAVLNHPFVSTGQPTRKIVLAKVAGFCFGVRRAVDLTLQERKSGTEPMATLGPIVHNVQVGEYLQTVGVTQTNSVDRVERGTVIISAHGASPQVRVEAQRRGLKVLDVTCPFVTKVHQSAKKLLEQGYQLVLVGDKGHTEVAGVVGAIEALGGKITVVSSIEDVDSISLGRKVGVISQTTQYSSTFADVVAAVCRRAPDVRAMNTVCGATDELQEAAIHMAKNVELAIVIGGKQSANSRRLREICATEGIPAYQVERAEEIDESWLAGKRVIGITAGASTPDWVIEEVARRLNGGELPEDWNLSHPEE